VSKEAVITHLHSSLYVLPWSRNGLVPLFIIFHLLLQQWYKDTLH